MGISALNEQNAAELAEGNSTSAAFQIAGAVGLTFTNHDVETTIYPTAQVSSSGALQVGSDILESKQTSVSAAATQSSSSSSSTQFAVAVGVGLYGNTAKATVDGDAQLNAGGSLTVESTVSYPILLLNPSLSFNPLDFLTNDLSDNQAFIADNQAFFSAAENGNIGYSMNLINTLAVATANTSSPVTGGAFVYNQFTNDSEATLEPARG